MPRKTRHERFLSYVDFTDSCWLWKGYKSGFGHGSFWLGDGQKTGAHRYAWMHYKGEIPKDIFVLHKCDVPNCVNPEHLFLGTPDDNMKDMAKKGRGRGPNASGELNPRSKLSNSKVQEIRKLYKPRTEGLDQKSLAEKYGISKSQISNIVSFKRWLEE